MNLAEKIFWSSIVCLTAFCIFGIMADGAKDHPWAKRWDTLLGFCRVGIILSSVCIVISAFIAIWG